MPTDAANRLSLEMWQDPLLNMSFSDLREDLGEVASSGKLPLDVLALVVPETLCEGLEGGSSLAGENDLAFFELLVSPVAGRGLGELQR